MIFEPNNRAVVDLVKGRKRIRYLLTPDVVYVGVINKGQLAGVFRSVDMGENWTPMDTP